MTQSTSFTLIQTDSLEAISKEMDSLSRLVDMVSRKLDQNSLELKLIKENLIAQAVGKTETNSKPEQRWLTRTQLAEKLDVTKATIDNWKKNGDLKFRRQGRRIYFLEDEVIKGMPSNEKLIKKLKR